MDSIRWVRPDCIILGCFRLTADGQEENYIVQVIRNKDGKITDVSNLFLDTDQKFYFKICFVLFLFILI